MKYLEQAASLTEQEENAAVSRDKRIIRTSMVGIGANLLLAGLKAVTGVLSGSIAIVLDAVNNLSDAASSVITIAGTKLAAKHPDKKHPWGYGRIEYLTAMVISLIVLYAGITSLVESVKKILTPVTPDYSVPSLIIVGAAVVVKIVMGRYVKGVGEKVNSDSLINSGTDAMMDSVISAATLGAAIIYLLLGIKLEAFLGGIISIVIIKSGLEMLGGTLSEILGERVSPEKAAAVIEAVTGCPDVIGAYDLVLHDYGPDITNGSVHIEVADTHTAHEIDTIIHDVTARVYEQTGVILTAVSIYAMNTQVPEIVGLRKQVCDIVMKHDNILQVHGFYADTDNKTIHFDMVVSFDEDDRLSLFRKALEEVRTAMPDFDVTASLDTDYSLT